MTKDFQIRGLLKLSLKVPVAGAGLNFVSCTPRPAPSSPWTYTGDGWLEGEAVDPPVVDYPDVPRLGKLSQIYHKLIFMRVCQVFQHQQCANGLLDQHTILTIVHQSLWYESPPWSLFYIGDRESWEGFWCCKICITVCFLFFFLENLKTFFLLFTPWCWWLAPSGTWKLVVRWWCVFLFYYGNNHHSFIWFCMKAATWGWNCLWSDLQRGSEASVLHQESCASFCRHHVWSNLVIGINVYNQYGPTKLPTPPWCRWASQVVSAASTVPFVVAVCCR